MKPVSVVNAITAVASAVAASCWLRSALIQVPDNIDTIVGELQRIGYWNTWRPLRHVLRQFQ
jgi:hypothetical protein